MQAAANGWDARRERQCPGPVFILTRARTAATGGRPVRSRQPGRLRLEPTGPTDVTPPAGTAGVLAAECPRAGSSRLDRRVEADDHTGSPTPTSPHIPQPYTRIRPSGSARNISGTPPNAAAAAGPCRRRGHGHGAASRRAPSARNTSRAPFSSPSTNTSSCRPPPVPRPGRFLRSITTSSSARGGDPRPTGSVELGDVAPVAADVAARRSRGHRGPRRLGREAGVAEHRPSAAATPARRGPRRPAAALGPRSSPVYWSLELFLGPDDRVRVPGRRRRRGCRTSG